MLEHIQDVAVASIREHTSHSMKTIFEKISKEEIQLIGYFTAAGGELAVSADPSIKEAKSTTSKVYVNGKEVSFTAYNINGSNYFKLRDIAKVIDFGVT